jgi:hypothetical protein
MGKKLLEQIKEETPELYKVILEELEEERKSDLPLVPVIKPMYEQLLSVCKFIRLLINRLILAGKMVETGRFATEVLLKDEIRENENLQNLVEQMRKMEEFAYRLERDNVGGFFSEQIQKFENYITMLEEMEEELKKAEEEKEDE